MTFDDAHRLIKKGDIAGMRRALDGGLDVNLRETALSLAAQQGHSRFVEFLLRAGASTNSRPH
jgi:hypothetical protein